MHDTEGLEQNDKEQGSELEAGIAKLRAQIFGHQSSPAIRILVLLNLIVLFVRPQYEFSGVPINYLFLVLSLIPGVLALTKFPYLWGNFSQVKAICLILLIGLVHIPIALNTFWAFHAWRDLLAQQFCFFFPLILFFTTGRGVRTMVKVLIAIGVYLGLYSLTHGGTGPGAFLADENDLAFAILGFLGIPLLLMAPAKGMAGKLWMIFFSLIMLAGIVATSSRGGFVGLVGLLGYMYLRSPAKLVTTLAAIVIGLGSLFYVPQEYWEDMSTIKQTDSGTAQARREMWSIATDIWLHPTHFLFGTGMNNAIFWMSHFEPVANRSAYKKSYAGRAVHSTFFQLLPDLGLAGFLLFSWVVWASFMGNSVLVKKLRKTAKIVRALVSTEESGSLVKESGGAVTEPAKERLVVLKQATEEIRYLSALMLGLNACWLGAIGAGLFVSVFYYPTYWLLASCTVTTQLHAKRLLSSVQLVAEEVPTRW